MEKLVIVAIDITYFTYFLSMDHVTYLLYERY